MLHVLKFTSFEEVHDEFTVNMTLTAEFEGETIVTHSPVIAQSKAVDSNLDKHFRMLVEDIISEALRIAKEKDLLKINIDGMTFQDKISMFMVRQTVGFTNDLYKSCRHVSVVLTGIW
jgi:hypothetical protein